MCSEANYECEATLLLPTNECPKLARTTVANSKVPFPALSLYPCFQTMCGFCLSMHPGFLSLRVLLGIVIYSPRFRKQIPSLLAANKQGRKETCKSAQGIWVQPLLEGRAACSLKGPAPNTGTLTFQLDRCI